MRFWNGLISPPHTFITPQNGTDFKDVISYFICSHVLKLRACAVLVITNGIYVFGILMSKIAIYNEARTQTSIDIDIIVVWESTLSIWLLVI